VWWRGETHQYPNISTHTLRLNTPKEEQKNEGMTERKNDHPLDPNIPKDQGRKWPTKKPPKYRKNFKKNQTNIHKSGWWWNIWWWTQNNNMFRGVALSKSWYPPPKKKKRKKA
jgi:hypothetical protein